MKKPAQRYCLTIHARTDEAFSAEERHARFFESIKELPDPWGPGDRPIPTAPSFGRSASAVISVTKSFGKGVKRAMLNYKYRRLLRDDHLSDDALVIDFDPAKVDLQYLIHTAIPKYIEAFDAYRVDCYDEQFVNLAYEKKATEAPPPITAASLENFNLRSNVNNVWPVSFYDELLCRRAFDLAPAQVLERVQGKIEQGRLVHGGVYLVGSSHVLSFEEAQQLCHEMKQAILG